MNNFKCNLLIILCLFFLKGYSQKPGIYWIQFTDKNNTAYNVTSPGAFLSQRAIDRRNRQNIPVVLQDIPVNQNYIDSINNYGLQVFNSSKWLNGVLVRVSDSTLIPGLSAISFVGSYTYVRPYTIKKYSRPKSELGSLTDDYNYTWGFDQINMLKGNVLHNLGYKGEGMMIGVIDAGFIGADVITVFDSLRNSNRLVSTRDFVTGNNDKTVYEGSSHGTNVLSTMASLINDTMVGTAPRANYSLILSEEAAVEYVFEEYTWVCAAEYADSLGVDIISTSLGYTLFDDPSMNHTWADINGQVSVASRAATIAARKGIIVVASAGNSGSQPWHKIGIPADADSILAVGAVNAQEQVATFTSVGPSADGRVKPDVAAMGWGTAVATASGSMTNGSGTSFSCPIIAGMTACLWQAHPNVKNMEIIKAIKMSASQYNNPDTLIGYGIPDFSYANLLLSPIVNYNSEGIKNIYPNPFNDRLIIDYFSTDSQKVIFEISDVTGRVLTVVTKETFPDILNEIIINNLDYISKGAYLLKISNNSGSYKRLLVKD